MHNTDWLKKHSLCCHLRVRGMATEGSARPSHVTNFYHACAKKYKMAESAELKVRRSLKSL